MESEMKSSIIFSCFIFFILALIWSSSVSARGGHGRHYDHYYGHNYYRPHRYNRFYYGSPFLSYSYTRSYPTTTVIREIEEPLVYIEKPAETVKPVEEVEPDASQYWYYCKKPGAYYPEVERCPDGWMQVVPRKPK